MKKLILIALCLLCSCSQNLTPDQYKAKENKKFVRRNITQQKGWKLYSITVFALVATYIEIKTDDN